jgi:hypothetical protein
VRLDRFAADPDVNVEFISREEIRAAIERLQGLWDYFV